MNVAHAYICGQPDLVGFTRESSIVVLLQSGCKSNHYVFCWDGNFTSPKCWKCWTDEITQGCQDLQDKTRCMDRVMVTAALLLVAVLPTESICLSLLKCAKDRILFGEM